MGEQHRSERHRGEHGQDPGNHRPRPRRRTAEIGHGVHVSLWNPSLKVSHLCVSLSEAYRPLSTQALTHTSTLYCQSDADEISEFRVRASEVEFTPEGDGRLYGDGVLRLLVVLFGSWPKSVLEVEVSFMQRLAGETAGVNPRFIKFFEG